MGQSSGSGGPPPGPRDGNRRSAFHDRDNGRSLLISADLLFDGCVGALRTFRGSGRVSCALAWRMFVCRGPIDGARADPIPGQALGTAPECHGEMPISALLRGLGAGRCPGTTPGRRHIESAAALRCARETAQRGGRVALLYEAPVTDRGEIDGPPLGNADR